MHDPAQGNVNYCFTRYLKTEFEQVLAERESVTGVDIISIAHIYLSFSNHELTSMLMKRGKALAMGEVWTQIEWEMKAKRYMLEHEEQLTTTVHAYITFGNEESFQRASRIEAVKVCAGETSHVDWNGTVLDFKYTNEPSNISYPYLYQEP